MASKSEVTFGKKIANAQQILTHVSTFSNFIAPDDDTTMAVMTALVSGLLTTNNNVATQKAGYSAAVAERQLHFVKDEFSLTKMLSPLQATVRSKLGKDAKVVKDLAAIIRKIRGTKLKKITAPKEGQTEEEIQTTISTSHGSYDSRLQHFSDLVATLETLGNNFVPVRNEFKLTQLKLKIDLLRTLNNNVTLSYGAFQNTIVTRSNDYKVLAKRIQQVKDAVKSQYGLTSVEYKLIKSLKV